MPKKKEPVDFTPQEWLHLYNETIRNRHAFNDTLVQHMLTAIAGKLEKQGYRVVLRDGETKHELESITSEG